MKDDKLPLEEIDSNWKYLASFEQATSNSTSEDIAHTYSSIANGKEVPDVLRELAQYLEVMNSFHRNNNEIDNDKINNLQSSSVYPYSSKEAIAIAKIRNSDITGAVEILHSLLNDRKCPTLIKANAQELLRIYDN
ncbi:hypothetical protein [Wolbachia endosymbiont of Ctenocephalides felis wCfeT]|uniref:hypothetical protein n=1 Tax=Wolbachia endosymbiont of Ctenocephalides felis wCfeT TaxID=2732593 RepID=UPI001FEBA9D5|nr:hypothetical protein [Wolbachia endosymbiont of Ctenocephalides felis wCfeT]